MKLNHRIIHFSRCLLQKRIPLLRVSRPSRGGKNRPTVTRKSPEVEDSNPFVPTRQILTKRDNSALGIPSKICL